MDEILGRCQYLGKWIKSRHMNKRCGQHVPIYIWPSWHGVFINYLKIAWQKFIHARLGETYLCSVKSIIYLIYWQKINKEEDFRSDLVVGTPEEFNTLCHSSLLSFPVVGQIMWIQRKKINFQIFLFKIATQHFVPFLFAQLSCAWWVR